MPSTVKYIDISVALSDTLPVWPGGYGFHNFRQQSIKDGYDANVTRLDFDVHSGTHIDAPLHFVDEGKKTVDIPLGVMSGKVLILDTQGMPVITAEFLQDKNLPEGIDRLLFKTENSRREWYKEPFDVGFIALDASAAQWLVDRKIILVGIDGPSIQMYSDPKDTHVILLQNDVVILEGLNLLHVEEGEYELICLPIKAENCEGIPARAVLINLI